jgi:hypothetical protein
MRVNVYLYVCICNNYKYIRAQKMLQLMALIYAACSWHLSIVWAAKQSYIRSEQNRLAVRTLLTRVCNMLSRGNVCRHLSVRGFACTA